MCNLVKVKKGNSLFELNKKLYSYKKRSPLEKDATVPSSKRSLDSFTCWFFHFWLAEVRHDIIQGVGEATGSELTGENLDIH